MIEGYITKYGGRRYMVNHQAEIYTEGSTPSGQWHCLGAIRFNNFGQRVEYKSFEELPSLNGQWLYKNGKQRWHIQANDYGTKHIWISPTHTGFFHAKED